MSGINEGPMPNEFHPELLGVMGFSFSDEFTSAARKQMFSSHIGQRLVINGATQRYIQTGVEREYGKYTFKTQMPVNADIIKVIERYPKSLSKDSISFNPETLVIYEDALTKEVGCLSITDYFSNHQYFGFRYKKNKQNLSKLRQGMSIPKNTVFADSPSIDDDGGFMFGREVNVAFMTHPAVSEDGIVISRSIAEQFKVNTYEVRTIEFGSKYYPINIHGDENTFKAFPDIGDYTRPDGLLMALRTYDDVFTPVEQSVNRTQIVDHIFDKALYAAGGGGRIVDIRVFHDASSVAPVTPISEVKPSLSMDSQALKYDNARRRYYQEILNTYNSLLKSRGSKLTISLELHRLIVEAIDVVGGNDRRREGETPERIVKLYRGVPLDDWRIEFVIEYTITPRDGFKFTDCVGGKGVTCLVLDDDKMPIDADGNRADMIMDPNASVNRMNPGRFYEQFYNGYSRDLLKSFRKTFNVKLGDNVDPNYLANHPELFNCWDRLLRFMQILSPKMYNKFSSNRDPAYVGRRMMYALRRECLTIFYPPNNEVEARNVIRDITAEFTSTYGPIEYVGYSGRRCKTKKPVRIASVYVMLLEKIADDWTAVSSCKLQNFGVISQLNVNDKYSTPTRVQGIRFDGETENRIIRSYAGMYAATEYLDRNNNIESHESMVMSILSANKPTNIGCAVDRNKIKYGGPRPLQLVKHYAMCYGWMYEYKPHVPSWASWYTPSVPMTHKPVGT